MRFVTISEVVAEKISGEWGDEPSPNEHVNVLRTTNFTNNGRLDYRKVVQRRIEPDKISIKKLVKGDVLIEKSGGSPTQPVGRVVFFDRDDETYLCNNFTSILRPSENVFPKYFFYCLFYLHLSNRTLRYQNKTTGIINLKLDRYLGTEKIPLPAIEEQIKIVGVLDQADELRRQRKEVITLIDEYLKSVFVEMFGDPMTNSKGWPIVPMGNVISDIVAGTSYSGEKRCRLENDEMGVLKISAVTSGRFNPKEFKAVKKHCLKATPVTLKKGDLLFSRANTRELVAATSIVDKDYSQLFLPDKLWRIDLKATVCDKNYFVYLLRSQGIRDSLSKTATGTSGSMLNISMQKLRSCLVPIPPISLQREFSAKLEGSDKTLARMTLQLVELNNHFDSLMQKIFVTNLVEPFKG